MDSRNPHSSDEQFRKLVASARRLKPCDALQAESLDVHPIEQLREYVQTQQPVLDLCRQLLHEPCCVATEFDEAYFERHMADIQSLRNLVRVLQAEVRVSWVDGPRSQAVDSALAMLRLGLAVRNGGLALDFLIGVVVTALGVQFFRKHRHELDAETSASAAHIIERIEREQESLETIVARDDEWERIVHPNANLDDENLFSEDLVDPESGDVEVQQAILTVARELVRQPSILRQMEIRQDHKQSATLRLLATELAIIAFRQQSGRLPKTLAELVAHLLDEIPMDPFSGKPLKYRHRWRNFKLCSVGPSDRDNKGRFTWWLLLCPKAGDLSLDDDEHRDENCACNS